MRSLFQRSRLSGLALCASLCFALPLRAQQRADTAPAPVAARDLAGQVLKGGEPVGGVEVTLHRVTSGASGPIGSVEAGPGGRFRFRLPPVDTGFAVFFATAEYQGIRYFGPPVHTGPAPARYEVEVFDTASSIPGGLRTSRRDIVLVALPEGGWEVNEVVRLRNPARRTLVAPPGGSTWEAPLPEAADEFQAGEGEADAGQVRRVGNRVFLLTAVTPGERELFLRYRLPARPASVVFPVDRAVDTMNLFVRQPAPEVTVTGLSTSRSLSVEGETFLQFGAADLKPSSRVALEWTGGAGGPVDPIVAGVAAALLVLAVGSVAAYRNRAGRPAPPATHPAR